MAERTDALEGVARSFAAARPADALTTLSWLYPAHVEGVRSVLEGRGTLAQLPATVASAVASAFRDAIPEGADSGEARPSVLVALGRPRPPRRRSTPPVHDIERLGRWVLGRGRLGLDDARAALDADPTLAGAVFSRATRGARVQLYLDAAHGRSPLRPVDFAEGIDTVGGPAAARRGALRDAWRTDGGAVWGDPDAADPPWWRLAEATCSLGGAWMAGDVPASHHRALTDRVAPRRELWDTALEWLARSGASFETLEVLLDDPVATARAATVAADRDCAVALAGVAAREASQLHHPELLLGRFGARLDLDAMCALAVATIDAVAAGGGPCPGGFLWDMAAGRGDHPVDRARFAELCRHVAERRPDAFDVAVSEPYIEFSPPPGPWRGTPNDAAAPLVELMRARAERIGWKDLYLLAPGWPSAAAALGELLAEAVDRAGADVDVGVLLELLDGWPGTLDELAATAASAASAA